MAPGKPYEAKKRIWILSGAEPQDLGNEAANALLKVLEEPPSHVVFILLATNPDAVLSTIRSRCQQLMAPGVVAVAKQLGIDADVPELAASPVEATELNAATDEIRKALTFGLAGETGPLVRLPYRLPDGLPPFAAVASVALEMACESEEAAAGEGLARLAADLLATERRAGALNLNVKGQLVSGLMRWYRELN